jgi:hypothetical protein
MQVRYEKTWSEWGYERPDFLYPRRGWHGCLRSLSNLLLVFCHDLESILPMKPHGVGTMMAIRAGRTIMTKQATRSPIDLSINHGRS